MRAQRDDGRAAQTLRGVPQGGNIVVMASAELLPSPNRFVVWTPDQARRANLHARAAGLGEVADLSGDPSGLVLELAGPAAEPRVAWARVRRALGEGVPVEPVLLDERQQPLFPTGTVIVRFRAPLADEDLERFALAHGLSVRARNRYVPAQVTFSLERSDRFLLDVLDELRRAQAVGHAWADTRAQFRRQ